MCWLQGLAGNPSKWTDMAKEMEGVSEETTTGVKRLYEMQVITSSSNWRQCSSGPPCGPL